MINLYNKSFGICMCATYYKNEVNGLAGASPRTGLDHLSGHAWSSANPQNEDNAYKEISVQSCLESILILIRWDLSSARHTKA